MARTKSTLAALLLVKAERSTKAFHHTMDALNAMDTPRFDTIVPKAQSYKRSLGTNPHQLGKHPTSSPNSSRSPESRRPCRAITAAARPVPLMNVLRQQNKTSKTAVEPLVMLSLRIPVSLKTRLKTTAAAHDLPMQQLLRAAIERELDRLGGATTSRNPSDNQAIKQSSKQTTQRPSIQAINLQTRFHETRRVCGKEPLWTIRWRSPRSATGSASARRRTSSPSA